MTGLNLFQIIRFMRKIKVTGVKQVFMLTIFTDSNIQYFFKLCKDFYYNQLILLNLNPLKVL